MYTRCVAGVAGGAEQLNAMSDAMYTKSPALSSLEMYF